MVGLGVQLNVPALLAHANSDLDRIDRTICSQRDIQLHRTVCSTGMRTFPRSSTEAQILGGQTCILNAWTSRTEETGESNLCSGCLTDGSPIRTREADQDTWLRIGSRPLVVERMPHTTCNGRRLQTPKAKHKSDRNRCKK
jgi:hypothetical protein